MKLSVRVTTFKYTSEPDQPSFLEKVQGPIEWAGNNKPALLLEVYPNNQMQFNEEMAGKWVSLLKDWKKSIIIG